MHQGSTVWAASIFHTWFMPSVCVLSILTYWMHLRRVQKIHMVRGPQQREVNDPFLPTCHGKADTAQCELKSNLIVCSFQLLTKRPDIKHVRGFAIKMEVKQLRWQHSLLIYVIIFPEHCIKEFFLDSTHYQCDDINLVENIPFSGSAPTSCKQMPFLYSYSFY